MRAKRYLALFVRSDRFCGLGEYLALGGTTRNGRGCRVVMVCEVRMRVMVVVVKREWGRLLSLVSENLPLPLSHLSFTLHL